MTDYTAVSALLAQKKQLFLELESVTADMSLYQVEELAECMEKRSRLLQQVEQADDELRLICSADEQLRQVLNNQCSREELSPTLAALYDASLSIKAVVNRMMKNDDAIKEHLEYEKQRITQKIEELNQSGAVVADKYYRSVQTAINRPLGSGKDRMI